MWVLVAKVMRLRRLKLFCTHWKQTDLPEWHAIQWFRFPSFWFVFTLTFPLFLYSSFLYLSFVLQMVYFGFSDKTRGCHKDHDSPIKSSPKWSTNSPNFVIARKSLQKNRQTNPTKHRPSTIFIFIVCGFVKVALNKCMNKNQLINILVHCWEHCFVFACILVLLSCCLAHYLRLFQTDLNAELCMRIMLLVEFE